MAWERGVRPLATSVACSSRISTTLAVRCLSSTVPSQLEAETSQNSSSPPPPPPGVADPSSSARNTVSTPRTERRLIKNQKVLPVGSRRRRAAEAQAGSLPFSQLPYQCFQEARKFLQEVRNEKLEEIRVQKERIEKLKASAVAPQDEDKKERRLASMRRTLEENIILADINDPLVKKRFEDGQGDLLKPIYRHFADKKWREYKRPLLMQRIEQMNVVPDVLPSIDPTVSTVISFGRKKVQHGDFVDSVVSEKPPTIDVQCYNKGTRKVTIAVVNADVPDVAKDGYTYRCHFLASNVEISPTETTVDLGKLNEQSQVILPWLPAYSQKGIPYQRMSVFILQQSPPGKPLDTATHDVDVQQVREAGKYTVRDGFVLRSFADRYQLAPVGADLFRTKWDDGTAEVMKRAGIAGWDVEFKRKLIEPLPYQRMSTARYR